MKGQEKPRTREDFSKWAGDDIDAVITDGIVFRSAPKRPQTSNNGKVKTKARKKGYITGAHGSASAKKKADIRRQRANRHK